MSTDEELARRIDLAVFPGEQGGPHPQKFRRHGRYVQNSPDRGLPPPSVADRGERRRPGRRTAATRSKTCLRRTDSHFCVLDLNSVNPQENRPSGRLRGEPAVRILDLAGIVANKNTIPGDTATGLAMGIRLGTPWLSQRGFGPAEIDRVAGLITRR